MLLHGLKTREHSNEEMLFILSAEANTNSEKGEDLEDAKREEMKQLLEKYNLIFAEPRELPLPRNHDHKILIQ